MRAGGARLTFLSRDFSAPAFARGARKSRRAEILSRRNTFIARTRVMRTITRRSHDILGLRVGFHHAQFLALLDAIIKLVPETEKILRGGNKGAGAPNCSASLGCKAVDGMLFTRLASVCNDH